MLTTENIDQWIVSQIIQLIGVEADSIIFPFLRLISILCLSFFIYLSVKGTLLKIIKNIIVKKNLKFGSYLVKHNLFSHSLKLLPIGIILNLSSEIGNFAISAIFYSVAYVSLIIVTCMLIYSILDATLDIVQHKGISKKLPVKSLVQLLKIIITIIGAIIVIAEAMGTSPAYLLSGLGAISAVLMLVFKDAILGLVAGFQLSAQKMVSVGDWIEMPNYNVDGDVIDISLTTVKVKNWDNTISTIPAYYLITESVKNWSFMATQGRRIKRSVSIDINSIKFIEETEISILKGINILKNYFETKELELTLHNKHIEKNSLSSINGRQLTNIGLFRLYIQRYLEEHSAINQELTLMVRQLAPNEKGVSLELYCFTKNTNWIHYENVQSDVFDHIFSIAPFFGIALHQSPTGKDFNGVNMQKAQ